MKQKHHVPNLYSITIPYYIYYSRLSSMQSHSIRDSSLPLSFAYSNTKWVCIHLQCPLTLLKKMPTATCTEFEDKQVTLKV